MVESVVVSIVKAFPPWTFKFLGVSILSQFYRMRATQPKDGKHLETF
jgi:hypothetical protein